jgi:hypothetical protein
MKLDWVSVKKGDHVILYASKLAACAGMHSFVSQDDLLNEFKRKCGIDTEFKTVREIAAEEIANLPQEHRVTIESTIAAVAKLVDTRKVREALDNLSISLSPSIYKDVKTTVQTQHGTRKEADVRKAVSREMKKEIVESHDFRVSKYPICTVDGIEVYIGGKHDGAVDDKIVEIKTRQRRFLGTPLYERVQVHAYMTIFGVREALLIESFDDENRTHPIAFDDGLWDSVKDAVADFVGEMLEFMD